MVAVTGPDADVQGAGAAKKLLKPRYATRKDHELWAEELREIADLAGLDRMYHTYGMFNETMTARNS